MKQLPRNSHKPISSQAQKKKLRTVADKAWFNKHAEENCEVCGCSEYLQVHHFYYKSSYGHLRYDDENAVTLCRRCHFILHHQDPKKIEDIIIDMRGPKWLNSLKKKANTPPPSSYQTIEYYKKIISHLL